MKRRNFDIRRVHAIILGAFVVVALIMATVIFASAADKPAAKPVATAPAAPTTSEPAPTISPLTTDEEEEIRVAQIDLRDAVANYQALRERHDKELLQSPEYQAQAAALSRLNAAVTKPFDKRKLKQNVDATLCDGPDTRPECTTLTKRKLSIQPMVKAPAPAADKK